MTKEMVIAANRHETKVAVLEDDQLVEVYFQRANEYSLAGSIHKGRVTRVLPGMQSAFVDLGLDRDTFLYVSDFFEESDEEFDQVPAERETRGDRGDRGGREQRPAREERAPREERGPREQRPEQREPRQEPRQEQPPREIAAAPVSELPAASEPAGGPVEPADASGDASAAERANRGDRPGEADRDRHRRSRRRRSRGRGFPDSKYAASASPYAPPERTVAEPVDSATDAEPVETKQDFSILPGESLAKYRHTPAPPAEHHYEQPAESEQNGFGTLELIETPAVSTSVDEAEVDELVAEALAEAGSPEPEAATEAEPPPPVEEQPQEAEKAAPEAAEHVAQHAEEVGPSAAQQAAHDTPEETQTAEGPAFEVPESFEAVEPAEAVAVEAAEAADATGPAEPAEAAVRSNSGRYMQHRVSRRMRRRMRSQGRPEGEPRPNGETTPEAMPAPEPNKIEARPDTRPDVRNEVRSEPRSESRPEPRPDSRAIARPEKGASPLITDLLKEGQEIIVQIAKEPLGQKGARITSHIALPGRYVVYMPTLEHMGVSRKIASDEERHRLKRILQTHAAGIQGGFIVRTAGEGKTEDDIAADMNFLGNLWIDIRQKAEKRPAPVLLHHDLDIVQRLLRDQLTENFKAIWVDNEEVYESILRFVQRFQPALVPRIKLYTRPAPIFDAFGISPELEKALRPKVWLKSGGYIVINQTEALVAIDVNTGKFVGKSNRLEDTIVKTNTEAVKEIVRQIRLRDLGGIIVVDFIDMDERKNRQKVMQVLEEAMRSDKAPNKILQFNDFGLVAITRKRVKQSLERALCAPCPYCEGAGYVKSVQTIIGEILQEAQKIATAVQGENNVILRVNPDVAKLLKSTQNKQLEELEAILRRPVMVKGDPLLHHEKFDLA